MFGTASALRIAKEFNQLGRTMQSSDVVEQVSVTRSSMILTLAVTDPNVVSYLAPITDQATRAEKALEALKVGVIAIQSASPMLDTQVVQGKFAEMHGQLRDQMAEFQKDLADDLRRYFEDHNGVVPRSIDGIFGNDGALSRTFHAFFDPADGRLSRLMQTQIGPQSAFGKALDPLNKQGIVSLIEGRVQQLIEAKLDGVLQQFSLDADGTAMSRLKAMLADFFSQLNQSLGIKAATAAEAEKGHVKGIAFEEDLYEPFAELGHQLGDYTELVRGVAGVIPRCKKGDYVSRLGETSGAPAEQLVVEVKDQAMRLRDAIEELQEAKKNREAGCGILVFARGSEPPEIGDFRRIGEDFYVTVDKDDLADGKPLLFLESAYKIARAMTVAAARKDQTGELDLQTIKDQIDALAIWSDRIADMATKARTVQNSGKLIEQCAAELKQDLDNRVAAILKALDVPAAA